MVTVLPLTVHAALVVEEKLTGRPDEAVAVTVNGGVPNVLLLSFPNVIVWLRSAAAGTATRQSSSAANCGEGDAINRPIASTCRTRVKRLVSVPTQRSHPPQRDFNESATAPSLGTARFSVVRY
jgi:hypothetical protein